MLDITLLNGAEEESLRFVKRKAPPSFTVANFPSLTTVLIHSRTTLFQADTPLPHYRSRTSLLPAR